MVIDEQRIFQYFKGIDAKREKAKQEVDYLYQKTDVYTSSYIEKFKQEKKQELIADRQERASKARAEIEQIKEELNTKQFKNPYDEITSKVITAQDKLLVEVQQNRKMQLLQAEMQVADTPEEFKSLLDRYGEYEDFYKLINLEIKKRAKRTNDLSFKELEYELNQEPEEFQELNKLEQLVSFFGNLDQHPNGLDSGDYKNIQYEPLI